MLITVLKTKIHRATITETDIHYNGSISIDIDLLKKSGIKNHEQVDIYNISNGERFTTYALEAPAGSKKIAVNGAASRLVHKGDLIIICSYGIIDESEASAHQPNVIIVNDKNEVVND